MKIAKITDLDGNIIDHMAPEYLAKIRKRLEYAKTHFDPLCGCQCNVNHHEAHIRDLEAHLIGEAIYYHEDCWCCLPSFGFGKEKAPES